MQRKYCMTFLIPGTLGANHAFQWKMQSGATLVGVSMCNTTAYAGNLQVGTKADANAYLAAEDFGVSDTPTEVVTKAGFDGATADGQFPAIPADTIMEITITDHGSHMANVCVVLTFVEGGV